MNGCRALLAMLGLWIAGSAHAAERAVLDGVSVHLFLARAGRLSSDVTAIPDFASWNSEPRGKGIPDNERFDGVLVVVRFRAPGEVFAEGEQARLTVKGDKRVVQSSRIADVYVGPEGVTHQAFFLPNVSCTRLDITVAGKGKTINKSLPFHCGE